MTEDRLGSLDQDAPLLQSVEGAFSCQTALRLGVAVSGGGDSVALLHLLVRVARQSGWDIRAVTVDHGLRPEAAGEALFVAQTCKALQVPHDTLRWSYNAGSGNLQDQARRARYRLIGDWAKTHQISHVGVGHTADDQAETFLMELAREAGLDGLSGMRPGWQVHGVNWVRPLLNHTREDLRDYLIRHQMKWIEDPSNQDEKFTRVKARNVLKELAQLGITAQLLSKVSTNLSLSRQTLEEMTAEAARQNLREVAGEVIVGRKAYETFAPDIARRLLIGALKWVSGADYAPRADALFRLDAAIRAGEGATLSGCHIRVGDAEIRIAREFNAVADIRCNTDENWDVRWVIMGPSKAGFEVRALGAKGLSYCENWREIGASREALIASPAIWEGERLVAAPCAGLSNEWTAKLRCSIVDAFTGH